MNPVYKLVPALVSTGAIHHDTTQVLRGGRKRQARVKTRELFVSWVVWAPQHGAWRAGEISFGMN
jgi:hypothetical protein